MKSPYRISMVTLDQNTMTNVFGINMGITEVNTATFHHLINMLYILLLL